MAFYLWQIIIQNDSEIVVVRITKISILPKPVWMKHCHWNNIWSACYELMSWIKTKIDITKSETNKQNGCLSCLRKHLLKVPQ
jgi:hypothetical protein